MDLSPAQAKMAARAAALAQEQALRKAQPVVDTRQLGGSGLTQIPLAQRQAQIDQAQGGPATYGGSGLTQIPVDQRQALINAAQGGPASYFGQDLMMTPLADRQAAINQAQGRPTQYYGGAQPQPRMPQPQGPVRPQMMSQQRPQPMQMQRPQQPRGPVAAPQRPEPSFLQQAFTYAKPVTQGISALGSLFSLF